MVSLYFSGYLSTGICKCEKETMGTANAKTGGDDDGPSKHSAAPVNARIKAV
jgi:hypothetical protein